MIRLSVAGAALLALAACNTSVPNDVAEGVGFQDYQQYQTRRAALRGDQTPYVRVERTSVPIATAPIVTVRPPAPAEPAPVAVAAAAPAPAPAPAPVAAPVDPVAQLAAAAIAEVEQGSGLPEDLPLAVTSARGALPTTASNPDISDEQEFDAVAARETIESDAERRARMQANRVVVAPTALPDRPAGIGPNIIDYAVSTDYGVGERRHSRNPFGQGRHERNCLAFRSDDLAQEWFLANGGPTRDRRALDPDGDGFACAWNPDVYRAAALAARN